MSSTPDLEKHQPSDDTHSFTATSKPTSSPALQSHQEEDPDLAPIDQPPSVQAVTDHEPFQVLARHLSGVSQTGSGAPFDPPPDGGWQAWGVIAGAWFVLFVQFGIITSFGQFEEYYSVSVARLGRSSFLYSQLIDTT